MIKTKDLTEFMRRIRKEYLGEDWNLDREFIIEIVARLRAYDRICRDLKQLITRMSNGVDE